MAQPNTTRIASAGERKKKKKKKLGLSCCPSSGWAGQAGFQLQIFCMYQHRLDCIHIYGLLSLYVSALLLTAH